MTKKTAEGILILVIAVGYIIVKAVIEIFSAISLFISANRITIGLIVLSCVGVLLAYQIFILLYFKGKKFKGIKDSIIKYTQNCNDLNLYIQELKYSYINIKSYDYGQSHMIDDSYYNFKRNDWNKDVKSYNIHHCSATVCKNASNQPIKYLCKYFDIEKNEKTLSNFERVLNDFTSVEQGKSLLQKERDRILKSISNSVPSIVLFLSKDKLVRKLGFEAVDYSDVYIPVFTFQYVSAGGNSSSKCEIKLNIENLNKLINYLNDTIRWRKSIAGQRALMTSKLREEIKKRDNYTCCNCNLSIKDEPNLLLEIDHIIPLSKGGITTETNLQTLCWKCNRTKGAKIITV